VTGTFPLAGRREVRSWLWTVATRNRGAFAGMVTLFLAATVAGLVGPSLLGELVDSVRAGTAHLRVDLLALGFVGALLLQSGLRTWARFVAAVFGERLIARAREDLVRHAVALPLDTVESAGTGELLGRATSDVDKLDVGLRQAAPEIAIASVMVVLTAGGDGAHLAAAGGRGARRGGRCWSASPAGTGRARYPRRSGSWRAGRTCTPAPTRRSGARAPWRRCGWPTGGSHTRTAR